MRSAPSAGILSQKSRYALQALLVLAGAGPGQTLQIAAIAEREAIPKKFLEQILLDLKRAGIVDSRRGQKGGYLLLRRPQSVSLGDVLRATDATPPPSAGLADENAAFHAVNRVFARVAAVSAKILDGTTLAAVLSDISRQDERRSPIILVKR